jgi:hypothetical protein
MLLMHRRSLPHWYVPGAAHFVTYRLAGTLPANVVQALKDKKKAVASKVDSYSQRTQTPYPQSTIRRV